MFVLAVSCMSAALNVSATHAQAATDSTSLGTFQWRNVAHPLGGRATTAVGVVGDARLYYMGATGGGLWKTDDAGVSWKNISDGFFGTGSIGDIAVAPGDPSLLYVGTGEAPARAEMSTYGDGVYRSSDSGRTWVNVGLRDTRSIARVLIHPTEHRTIYVAALGDQWGPSDARGIYRSNDAGSTWTRLLFVSPTAGASDLVISPDDPRVLYAAFWDRDRGAWEFRTTGPGSGIWTSTDGGDHWQRLTNGLPTAMGKVRLAISPANPQRLWANIEADSGGIYRSDDAGLSWKRVNASRGVRTRPWYYLGIHADPKSPDIVYVTGVTLLKSSDGGATFSGIRIPHDDSHSLWINPSDTRNMILTTDGGATVTVDGGAIWSSITNQPTAQLYTVRVDDRFPYNLYSGQQDQGAVRVASQSFTTDDARGAIPRWMSVGDGETARMAFDPRNPRIVYVTNYWGIIAAFDTETGTSRMISEWPQEPLGTAPHRFRFAWSAAIAVSPNDPRTLYHAGNVVFRSRDGGVHWAQISSDLTRQTGESSGQGAVYDIVESPRDSLTLWAGTDDGLVHVTRNGGKTWTDVSPPNAGIGWVSAVEASPHAATTAYVALSRLRWQDITPHVYKTTDFGKTWRDVGAALPSGFPARVVREDPVRRDLLYAGTENGIFASFDGGATWRQLQGNLPRVPISDMRVQHDDLIVSTEGRAFWVLDDLTALRRTGVAVTSASIVLHPPRPARRVIPTNERGPWDAPSSPGATIWYSVSPIAAGGRDSLRLSIIDASGRVVRQESGDSILSRRAGLNRWSWNFRTAPRAGAVGPGGAPVAMGSPPPLGYVLPSARYIVRLSLGALTVSQPLDVRPDPRFPYDAAAERAHSEMARAITERSVEISTLIKEVRAAKTKARAPTSRQQHEANDRLTSTMAALDSVDEQLLQNRYASGPGAQDFLNYPPGLVSEYSYLLGLVDGTTGPITQAERDRFADLDARWRALLNRARTLVDVDLPAIERDTPEAPAPSFHVVLRPVRNGTPDVVALEVSEILSEAAHADSFSITAPVVYAGVSGIAERVEQLVVHDSLGEVPLTARDDAAAAGGFPFFRHWRAARPVAGRVIITYRSLVQPPPGRGPPFGIRAYAGGLSGAGSGFLVLPEGQPATDTRVHWDLSDLSQESIGAATFGVGDFQFRAPPEQLMQGWIMAGPLGRLPKEGSAQGFSAFWLGTPAFDVTQEMSWSSRMYAFLGAFYKYLSPPPPYRVFIRVLPDGKGATALDNSFMIITNPSAVVNEEFLRDLRETITHEMGHQWVGSIDGPDGIVSWFTEGLNVYYTRLLPMRGGFVSVDDYVRRVNDDFRTYYNGKSRNLSADSIVKIGFGDEEVRHIPYLRGSFYFADVDARIRAASRGKRNLDTVIHELFQQRRRGTPLNQDRWLAAIAREIGPAARQQFGDVILRGKTLVPSLGAFGPCLVRREAKRGASASEVNRGYEWVRDPKVSDAVCRGK